MDHHFLDFPDSPEMDALNHPTTTTIGPYPMGWGGVGRYSNQSHPKRWPGHVFFIPKFCVRNVGLESSGIPLLDPFGVRCRCLLLHQIAHEGATTGACAAIAPVHITDRRNLITLPA